MILGVSFFGIYIVAVGFTHFKENAETPLFEANIQGFDPEDFENEQARMPLSIGKPSVLQLFFMGKKAGNRLLYRGYRGLHLAKRASGPMLRPVIRRSEGSLPTKIPSFSANFCRKPYLL